MNDARPPAPQPWDPMVGLKLGGFVGALAGGAVLALTGTGLWVVFAGAGLGSAIGYVSERRKQPPR